MPPRRTRSHEFALFYESKHAGQGVFYGPRTKFVNVAAKTDRVRNITPNGRTRLFKFTEQERFFSAVWKEHVDRLQMRACHGKDVGGAIDQGGSKWLAAQPANIHAFLLADLHCIKTWRLPAYRMDAG